MIGRALAVLMVLAPGCAPKQPFYFHEDGDLSHYKDVATDIEYPDVESCTLDEVAGAAPPATLRNIEEREPWPLPLEEAVQTALANSKVVRQLRAGYTSPLIPQADGLLRSPDAIATVYDPAIVESDPRLQGVEAALSEFDAQLTGALSWQKNETPQNFATDDVFAQVRAQDLGSFQAELAKQSVTGSRFAVRHQTVYDWNNSPIRAVPSDWSTNFELEARQPFLRGAGMQFNRIAGPIGNTFGSAIRPFSGVVIARINNDITLADFEAQVLNQVSDVEITYRELYFAYRDLDAKREGRDSALQEWRRVKTLAEVGDSRGRRFNEARARQQYFLFRSQVEDALCTLFEIEARLRYLMGIAASDCRIIRPVEEPSTARVEFDWCAVQGEALARVVHLRRQKWQIKRAEMELIAARNYLLPQLDGVARYRFLGLGDDLIDPNGHGIPPAEGSDAFSTLTDGDFQEWELGLQMSVPIGFRRELSAVRHYQLRLARERARLQDQELEVSHTLSDAIRNLHCHYALMETNFNLWLAAEDQLNTAQTLVEVGAGPGEDNPIDPFDQLLQAQRNLAEAKTAYFRSLVDYNKSITEVHFRKGSLLEYNNVFLAEGPWPGKAYFDACERGRERDAGLFVDYGFTRPRVMSRGPYEQFQHGAPGWSEGGAAVEGVPTPAADPADESNPPFPGSAVPGPVDDEPPGDLPRRAAPEVPSVIPEDDAEIDSDVDAPIAPESASLPLDAPANAGMRRATFRGVPR
jgi:outer membrane protein TolC